MSDRTYVFDNNDGGGCNNGGFMSGMLASLCQRQGIDPNVLAMLNNRNGNGMDVGWGWWIIILLIFGWGGFGNGFGGGFGGRGTGQGLADLGNLVNNDAGRELLMQAIQGNGQAISQLASTVHCDTNTLNAAIQNLSTQVCGLGNQIGLGQRDIIQQILMGNNGIISNLCECCCGIKAAIADFKGDVTLQMCQQTGAIQNSINGVNTGVERLGSSLGYALRDQTCSIEKMIEAQNRLIADKFGALEMREVMRENQALRDERSQYQMSALLQQQSQNIINTVRPCPIPAFVTCNPWATCGCGYGNGYNNYGGCNNGGCGNNGCGGCC